MDQIEQLRKMREEALQRLQANPDFKLANSLDSLIQDLEAITASAAKTPASEAVAESASEAAVEETAESEVQAVSTATTDDASIEEEPTGAEVQTAAETEVAADAEADYEGVSSASGEPEITTIAVEGEAQPAETSTIIN